MSLSHSFVTSQGWLDPPTTILSCLLLLGLVALAVWRAREHRLLSFSILWVLLHLGIESSVVPLEMVYEHRMYLPMAGIAILGGWAMFRFVPAWPQATVATALLVLLFVGFTHDRNEVWRTRLALWSDIVAKYPQEARAACNLGSAYFAEGDPRTAAKWYKQALQLDPEHADAQFNLAVLHAEQGDSAEAKRLYQLAIEHDPGHYLAHNNLGNLLAQSGKLEPARKHLRRALEVSHYYYPALFNLGNVLRLQGKAEEAIARYRDALQLNAEYLSAELELAKLLESEGRLDEALESFQKAQQIARDEGKLQLAALIQGRISALEAQTP